VKALATFKDDLEAARADLEAAIADIINDVDVNDTLAKKSDSSVVFINKAQLSDLLNRLVDAPEEIAVAFENYDWAIRRALRALQQALARETAEG
jgi:hypothetical protein